MDDICPENYFFAQIPKNVKGVTALVNNRESTYFLITVKEEEMLRQIRELSEADRKEIERRFLEIAVKYAEWSK